MKSILLLLGLCSFHFIDAQTEIPTIAKAKPEIAYHYRHPILTAGSIHFSDTQISMAALKKESMLSVLLNPIVAADNPVVCTVQGYKMTLITKGGVYEGTFLDGQIHLNHFFSKAIPGDFLMITDIKFYNPVKAVSQYCENAIFKLVE